jgi:hypothetical protein
MAANTMSPVFIHLGGYTQDTGPNLPAAVGEPEPGESIVYKIPPAAWIVIFLLIGYLGMRFVMED